MYQRTIVVGRLGRDPEMRYTQDGTPVTSFSVATDRKWNDREGNLQKETTWFRVSVWGRQAEPCNQYLSKGQMVLVDGRVTASAWKGADGEPRSSLELRADRVVLLSSRGEAGPREEDSDVRGPVERADEDGIPF